MKKEPKLTVQLQHMRWDDEYYIDRMNGNCIEITQKAYANKKAQEKNPNGIMSPEFCSDWSDIDAFAERYRCKCGAMKGKALEGEICESCGTKVTYKDVDYKKTGWISLNGYKIIQPNFYLLLESLIGSTQLQEIITKVYDIDLNGNEIDKISDRTIVRKKTSSKVRVKVADDLEADETAKKKKSVSNNPYRGKGMQWFSEHVREVIYFFWRKKKNTNGKTELAMYLLDNVDKIFASHIPVYTSALRPEKVDADTYNYYSINPQYNTIVTSTQLLKDTEMVDETTNAKYVENALFKIQSCVMVIDKLIFEILKGKEGHFVGKMLGGNYNYTSRCEIIPDTTLRANQIDVPYNCFLELFKFEIISHLCEIKGINESAAYNIWCYAASSFSEEIYQIMLYIIDKYEPACMLG